MKGKVTTVASDEVNRLAASTANAHVDELFDPFEPHARSNRPSVVPFQEHNAGRLQCAPHSIDVGGRTAAGTDRTFHAHNSRK